MAGVFCVLDLRSVKVDQEDLYKYEIIWWSRVCVWCMCVRVRVGVCVFISSTMKASSDCKMSKIYLRGTNQRSCVVNIYLGASAKFLHLRI